MQLKGMTGKINGGHNWILFLVVVGLTSCTSKPTEKEVQDILNQNMVHAKDEKASLFTLENLKKIDGVAGENGGIKTYQMKFAYDVIAKTDVVNYSYKLFGITVPKTETKEKYLTDSASISKTMKTGKWSDYHQNVIFLKKGEKYRTDTGTIMLKKTEKGWSTMGY